MREMGFKFAALGEERERDEKDEFVIKSARENQVNQDEQSHEPTNAARCPKSVVRCLSRVSEFHDMHPPLTGQGNDSPGETVGQGRRQIHHRQQDDHGGLRALQRDAGPQGAPFREWGLPQARRPSANLRTSVPYTFPENWLTFATFRDPALEILYRVTKVLKDQLSIQGRNGCYTLALNREFVP